MFLHMSIHNKFLRMMIRKLGRIIRNYFDMQYRKYFGKLFHILDMFHKYFDRIIRN